MRVGNSCIERLQAARHSAFVMCVAASQKLMQSASDLPPPPGLLGFDWLGLLFSDAVPGERARSGEEPPEEPPAVPNWLGKGSDMGDSGGTVDPGCAVVGVFVAGTPAGGVSPAEGVGDNVVDGAAGVEGLGLGAATDAGAPPADERACASAASGSSSERAMAARKSGLGVSIANHLGVAGGTPSPVTIGHHFCGFCGVHKLASERAGGKRGPPLRHSSADELEAHAPPTT